MARSPSPHSLAWVTSQRLDKLELLETIVFSLILVSSWVPIFDLIDQSGAGSDEDGSRTWAILGSILAILMLIVQVCHARGLSRALKRS